MCGIVGIVETEGEVERSRLRAMNQSMAARGPDGAGYYFSESGRLGMAMRRLSIIDLQGGWQPLYSEDRQVVAMQNGEIYNHRELRRQLESFGHCFQTQSDTEVLAHGYEQWGIEKLLERLDGMFALAIHDVRRNQLHLARDRFGEKPLYYHATPRRFVYGSQMLTVASYPGVDCSWDPAGLYLYLALHYVPGPGTVWRGVRKIQPGQYASIDLSTAQLRLRRYWALQERRDRPGSVGQLHEILDQTVQSRLLADVPVGIFLSGGLDSSVLAALAARHVDRITTFSMGFRSTSHDERPFAECVAQHLGADHHHFEFDGSSFLELLPKVVAAMDEPVGDQAMLPLYWLCAEAAKSVKVVLSGEGADELFAGYSYYAAAEVPRPAVSWMERWRRRLGWLPTVPALILESVTPSGFPILTSQAERQQLLGLRQDPDLGDWHERLLVRWNKVSDPLRRPCLADVETWLAEDLLMKFDKMAMAHSLEGRAPYLSPRVAEFAFNLPASQKLTARENKKLLREVAAGLIPTEISQRPKQGFVLPMRQWLADYLARDPHGHLFRSTSSGLDGDRVARLVEEDVQRGITRERLLYPLVVLMQWAVHARVAVRQIQENARDRSFSAA